MVLIISHPADDHAMAVLDALRRIGHPATLLDTAQFPTNASVTQRLADGSRSYEFMVGKLQVDLGSCGVAWWRRPQPFTLEAGLAPEAISFAYTECHEAVAGLWAALDLTWVNPPALDEVAHHKPYQLAVATKVGLPIPRTVITNNPDAARQFIVQQSPEHTVYKTFLASEQCWRETRLVRPEEMAILDTVRLAPVIFQEYIQAESDIRITVVGHRMFATAISATPGGYQIDYRMDLAGALFTPTDLPPSIGSMINALMRRLGLVYGAIDMRRTPDGRHVFLEVNPAGEWRFVEERTGQPITEAMANLLAGLDDR